MMTIGELMEKVDEIIEEYIERSIENGEKYDINEILSAKIIIGDDDELNGVHGCHTADLLNEEEKDYIKEIACVTIKNNERVFLIC